ncbi:MAG: hypothetical protein ABIU29_11960 [Chthoniobacterales bacterium]
MAVAAKSAGGKPESAFFEEGVFVRAAGKPDGSDAPEAVKIGERHQIGAGAAVTRNKIRQPNTVTSETAEVRVGWVVECERAFVWDSESFSESPMHAHVLVSF